MFNKNIMKRILSLVCLILFIGIANPIVIPLLRGYPSQHLTIKIIGWLVDIICLTCYCLALIYNDAFVKAVEALKNRTNSFFKWYGPDFSRMVLPAIPLLLLLSAFFSVIAIKGSIGPMALSVRILILQSTLTSSLFDLLLLKLAYDLSRSRIFTVIVALFVVAVSFGDWIAVSNGVGRLSLAMLGWVTPTFVLPFLTPGLVLKLGAVAALVACTLTGVFKLETTRIKRRYLAVGMAVTALVYWADPCKWFLARFAPPLQTINMATFADGDPVMRLPSVILEGARQNYRLVDLATYEKTKSGLFPMVDSRVEVPRARAKKIILVLVESLSLNFLKSHNDKLPESITPFLDSLASQTHSVWTCSSPSSPGLATHFCSHPNYEGAITLGYPHSVVRNLRDSGWETILFQSPPENFDSGLQRFKELGFMENFGPGWQSGHGNGTYVKGLGVCDRITFRSMTDYLVAHRAGPLFLCGIAIDTHLPVGRSEYGDLSYPDEPAWTKTNKYHAFLRSIFREDYDLKEFVNGLKDKGLLDKDTVVLITADHSCPPFFDAHDPNGLDEPRFAQIPLIVIQGNKEHLVPSGLPRSQLDTAPTVAYFAGLKPDPAWWGVGLQSRQAYDLFSFENNKGLVFDPGQKRFSAIVDKPVLDFARTFLAEKGIHGM